MTQTDPKRLVVVGVLRGAHGVQGEVRIKSFTSDPAALFTYGPLFAADGTMLLDPASARPGSGHFIVRPRVIKSKEHWDSLSGTLLHVTRERLPPPDADEFYVEDLVGLRAKGPGGAPLGRIKAVQNFGGGDLLEIEIAGERETLLVPFTKTDVARVDLADGSVELADPEAWRAPPETAP